MQQYLDLLRDVRKTGTKSDDRTGTGTLSVFGRQLRFDLRNSFPILTTKKIHWKSVVYELLWFIKGDTNIRYLHDHHVTIWDEWADEKGDLGPIYGCAWRSFSDPEGKYSVDQLWEVISSIRNNPNSRRHMVCAWNPLRTKEMALPPCHCLFQFYVRNGELSCQLYQR